MQTVKATRRPAAEKAATPDSLFLCGKGIFRGAIAQLLVGTLLSLAATGIAYANDDPDTVTPILGLGAALLSCAAGGFVAARYTKHSALLCGIGCGLSYVLTAFLLSWLLPSTLRGGWSTGFRMIMYGGTLLFSVLGAFCAVSLGTGSKKTRRRKRK